MLPVGLGLGLYAAWCRRDAPIQVAPHAIQLDRRPFRLRLGVSGTAAAASYAASSVPASSASPTTAPSPTTALSTTAPSTTATPAPATHTTALQVSSPRDPRTVPAEVAPRAVPRARASSSAIGFGIEPALREGRLLV